MNKYIKVIIILFGLYCLVSLIMGITSGQFHLLKYDTVISLSQDPNKFWSIAFLQVIFVLLSIILSFPKLYLYSFGASRQKKPRTLEQCIGEVEVYISYKRYDNAKKLLKSLLKEHPENKQLLALHEKTSKK